MIGWCSGVTGGGRGKSAPPTFDREIYAYLPGRKNKRQGKNKRGKERSKRGKMEKKRRKISADLLGNKRQGKMEKGQKWRRKEEKMQKGR